MKELRERKLTRRDYFVVSSMLFGLFFGAGNLIFPLHLGQLAGSHWLLAALGFLITAVLLPLFSVLAISVTRSEGVYDIGKPLGAAFALVFMVLIHATIGPLFGTPRTATVSFTVGVAPFLPKQFDQIGLFVFSLLFFGLAFILSYKENNIVKNVGKVLNPLFLLLLFVVFLVAFTNPLGSTTTASVTKAYLSDPFTNGFLQGYNTMDALAGLAFGVTVVTAVKQLGKKKPRSIALTTARAGILTMAAIGLIYLLLILVGAMSLGKFKVSADGGVAFTQIVNYYAGRIGQAFLATLLTLTCLTTAVGLVAAFAQDFHKHFPKVSYHVWLAFSCLASFLTANFGLDQIITWSVPLLMFLYPLAMALIVLSITSPWFKRDSRVYLTTVVLTVVPAFFDMVVSFPAVVSQSSFGLAVANFQQKFLPLANVGLDWLVPAVVGFALGLVWHFAQGRAAVGVVGKSQVK
ncbi:branched-chain amino acid transport system II carrier protein [Liquorilactobacillus vini]|uniref:branched-chain amino acid transport system II carrier protein n=1 Tax=Liquorilactobacillus vini TaxID=238015 RepID=UPI00030113C3|nr:branched-chain amino acid transport system II carrier protein [Liquorilactobacillus vini]